MRQDLQYMAENLTRLHIDAFHSVSKSEFFDATDALDREVEGLTDGQFAVRMKQLVVLIGDGHTSVNDTVLFRRGLPLRFSRFSDGVFVVVASGEYAELVGKELTAVEGRPIDDVVAVIVTIASRDTEYDLYGDAAPLVAFPDLLHGLGLTSEPDLVELALRGHDSVEFTHVVESLPTKEPEEWVRDPDTSSGLSARHRRQPYAYEYLEEPQVLYIAYNQCRDDKSNPFSVFARDVLQLVDDERPRAVAIDLRHNGGGNSQVLQPLIRELGSRSWLNRPDRLFVLIGPQTYSSAMLNAWQLDVRTKATLVGMPTGGKPNSYGEVGSFDLPNSRWTVHYCTKLFKMVEDDRPAILPDVRIEQSSTEYFSGRDAVVDHVLRRVAERSE